jgi:hypothetical protein
VQGAWVGGRVGGRAGTWLGRVLDGWVSAIAEGSRSWGWRDWQHCSCMPWPLARPCHCALCLLLHAMWTPQHCPCPRWPPPAPLPARCRYALWLDSDLTSGISRNSTTFGNDSLAGAEEFLIGAVELWGLS